MMVLRKQSCIFLYVRKKILRKIKGIRIGFVDQECYNTNKCSKRS